MCFAKSMTPLKAHQIRILLQAELASNDGAANVERGSEQREEANVTNNTAVAVLSGAGDGSVSWRREPGYSHVRRSNYVTKPVPWLRTEGLPVQ
jgi:hypothetical protein